MTAATEFSRPHRLDAIGAGEASVTVAADEGERTALAKRFGLLAIDRLEARFAIKRDATGIVARGHLSAAVTQACVVTGEPLPVSLEEDFALRFLPEPDSAADEVELDADECDTVFYTDGAIDLGEAAAETLLLSLDPFPRGPNAAATLKDAGVLSEEEAGPFGGLAALRDKLKK
ncbi:YceD family protein [Sphingomonas sp. DT-204]|uniref:YceD family protein n=1 Tax=Sphingomonas sp. DT-204 TaxID=3396166 RepID=UPI003F1A49D4